MHSIHNPYTVHRFWLVHGRFICTHIQQVSIMAQFRGIPILPRNTETALSGAALNGVLRYTQLVWC